MAFTSLRTCRKVDRMVTFSLFTKVPVSLNSVAACILVLISSVGQTAIEEKNAAPEPARAISKSDKFSVLKIL